MNVQTAIPAARRHRSRHDQGPPAGRLELRRLRRRRHDACRSSARACARRSICAATSASSTSPPATATRRWPPRAASPMSCRPTMSRALLERGRERADADRLAVTFQEADAEALPFDDASFDVVLSTFGVMFTPNQEQAAQEMLRVCRPGGKIGLANWTPESFIGQLFKTIGKYVPPAPGVKSPALWGTRAHLDDAVRAQGDRRGGKPALRLPLQVAQPLAGDLPQLLRPGPEGLRRDRSRRPARRSRRISGRCSTGSTSPRTARWSPRANISK